MDIKLTIKLGPAGQWVMVNGTGEYMNMGLIGFTTDINDAVQFERRLISIYFTWARTHGYEVVIEGNETTITQGGSQ